MSPAPRMSGSPAAVSVASHASPDSHLQAAAGQPLDVREGAEADDHDVGGNALAIREFDRLDAAAADQSGDPGPQPHVDATVPMQLRAPCAELRAEREHRGRGDVDQRDVEVLLARGLRHLAPDEARAHDRDPRALVERRRGA